MSEKKIRTEGLNKKESKFSKLLLGVIVGGAIGSVVGVTLSDKDRREKIKKTSQEIFGKTKNFVHNNLSKISQKKQKTGFWHVLHNIFHKK